MTSETIPRWAATSDVVTMTPQESSAALLFADRLKNKIMAKRKNSRWFKTRENGDTKIEQMCKAGLIGEFGFRKFMGLPQPDDMRVEIDYFDGGYDIQIGAVKVQVKAAANPGMYAHSAPWLLSPRNVPIKWSAVHYAALVLPLDDQTVCMVGYLEREKWRTMARPFRHDPKYANGVPGVELSPMIKLKNFLFPLPKTIDP
jgi:hypothetical protein